MALAAAVAAALIWVGWGFHSGMTAQEIAPATATPWDQEVDFDAPLDGSAGGLPGFDGVRVERAPGDNRFTVTVPNGDGRMTVERVEGDLPGELQLFRNDGSSLLVSAQDYEGEPHLQLSPNTAPTASYETSATDGDTRIHAWWLEGPVDPSSLMDLYWVSEDQLAASRALRSSTSRSLSTASTRGWRSSRSGRCGG